MALLKVLWEAAEDTLETSMLFHSLQWQAQSAYELREELQLLTGHHFSNYIALVQR
jgi:hypothetical protein